MQQGDYSSYYHQYPTFANPNPNPNPTPTDLHQTSYASAPPFSASYAPAPDYPPYSQNYPPYPQQNPDPAPPSAPSFNPPTPSAAATAAANPNPLSSFNQPAPPQSQPPVSSYAPYDAHESYNQQPQTYFPPYDQHQTASGYAPPPPPANPNPTTGYSSSFSSSLYGQTQPSVPPVYDSSYENPMKFEYSDEKYGNYNPPRSNFGSDVYGKRPDVSSYSRYDEGYGDGVYAYEGGKSEPYGARGTAPKNANSTLFDDYGRPINLSSGRDSPVASSGSAKVVRAVPKADEQVDVKGGVQKFRVKLLAESGGQGTMDVLCQVGLDGIRMLDPSTSRMLRIYPLENVTRCDVFDSSTFAFWSKSPVDIEPRRIRLQSNRYTTNALLDTVTAAIVQFKEMSGSRRPSEPIKAAEQSEKKKGLSDWLNAIKPINEEKDHWVPDEAVTKCTGCGTDFSAFNRKHHCRNCGDIFCDKCTQGRTALTAEENAPQVRVCDRCLAEVTQRLNNAKETASRPAALQSHEDLARKLQEEMEKNRKASSVSKSDGSGRRMKEVACPTCTVHLQVQVPTSGSETIECGVCQNPFLVSAH